MSVDDGALAGCTQEGYEGDGGEGSSMSILSGFNHLHREGSRLVSDRGVGFEDSIPQGDPLALPGTTRDDSRSWSGDTLVADGADDTADLSSLDESRGTSPSE